MALEKYIPLRGFDSLRGRIKSQQAADSHVLTYLTGNCDEDIQVRQEIQNRALQVRPKARTPQPPNKRK